MRLSLGILLITGAARLTVASPFTDALAAAPACAVRQSVTCAITALPQSPCTIENTTCLCTNPTFNGLIGDCVQKGCTIKEALTVQNLTWSACGFPSTDKRHSARYTIGCLIILPIIFMAIRLASWAFRLTPWGAEDTTVSLAFVCCTTRNIVWPPDFSFNQILFVPFPTLVLISKFLSGQSSLKLRLTFALVLSYGLGRDIWVLQPDEVTMFLKNLRINTRYEQLVFIIQFFYIVDLALIKASILYLYLRVFHMSSIRTVLWGTQVFNFILCTLFVLLSIFQCQPIQHYWNGWDGEHAGKCLSLQDIVLAHVAINVGLDVWMLILPLTQIYKLNMPLRRKISVMAMFSVGIL
ncbi:hypothetical protein GCG54_00014033 [Colletotrichum gloeosporioides]|uniref:CFEM domain-containing protein n=1 Tax=Colletotrichum gloeosporioides TaxID=474922 RepID=A0A8H4CF79_COLGL|nr:uncharacterized protein GCG54_00014033 [Colletotrichum gloeosporioides]KAF3802796.1 hypothetical protein GCG54_00014033 [Colletotrichum gloeosporioides]